MEDTTERLLRLPEVCKQTGLTRSTLYAHIATGDFAQPIALTKRTRAWPESEVQSWIRKRIAMSAR
jgi:prophage regulatory protein